MDNLSKTRILVSKFSPFWVGGVLKRKNRKKNGITEKSAESA